jgi:hypothetical protein
MATARSMISADSLWCPIRLEVGKEAFVESGKKTNVVLWASIAASAAGILAVAAIAGWREHSLKQRSVTKHLRDVQEILDDCYNKIHEIEEHLPGRLEAEVVTKQRHPRPSVRALTNGNPVFEA